MGDVLTFTPRPKPVAPAVLLPLTGPELRASLEEAAQTALDAADRIIAVLDRIDGDADHEDGAGSQVTWLRGSDRDGEAEAPGIVLPEAATGPQPEAMILPWRGRGNVIAAAGTLLLDLLEQA